MKNNFETLGLHKELVEGLKKNEITVPTNIQHSVIPLAVENMDIIAQSPTGSGKTLAYLLPIFQRIDSSTKDLQAIILAPTHELVHQIKHEIDLLNTNSGLSVNATAINGEANITRQIESIKKKKPHIVVGSTGRILELIQKKKLKPHTVKTIVIDECDKMFHKSNLENVKAIIKTTLRDRQLMAFSASVNDEALEISKEMMKSPKKVFVEDESSTSNLKHIYLEAEQRQKFKILRKALYAAGAKRAIIFINKNELIQDVTAQLKHHNFKVDSLFGNASKTDRRDAVKRLRIGKTQILVSSDLAARGLDIKGVTHVFNLDIPEDIKEYLHRAGRTGRAGKEGTVVSIVTPAEVKLLKKVSSKFDVSIKESGLSEGSFTDSPKETNKESAVKGSKKKDSKPVKNYKNKDSKKTYHKKK